MLIAASCGGLRAFFCTTVPSSSSALSSADNTSAAIIRWYCATVNRYGCRADTTTGGTAAGGGVWCGTGRTGA